jgi:kynurenine formamidase
MLSAPDKWTPRERALGLALFVLASVNVIFLLVPSAPAATAAPPALAAFLSTAKFVDLTHAIEPGMPVWEAFATPKIGAAKCGNAVDGFIGVGDTFSYADHGFVATELALTTDQLGTQLDPPAHWNELGATISDVPATVALRPLVVIDITAAVAADPGYHAQVSDVLAWEAAYGTVPSGSAVLFRSDWSKGWAAYKKIGMPASFPGVSLAALKHLHLERRILVHGHEPLDTDMTPSLEGEAWLMHNNFMQIEGATNLHLVPPAGALLSIGVPKVLGGTGGYARLVAICPPEWPHGATIDAASAAPLPVQAAPLRRGADGVMRPTAGAPPTQYCAEGSAALGCPMPQ